MPDRVGQWWKLDDEKSRAAALWKTVERIEHLSSQRRDLDLLHMRLYGNRDIGGNGRDGRDSRLRDGDQGRLRFNLCQATCDALQAKIAKLRPRPRFLTDRGNWSMQKRAETMEQMVDGEFYRSDIDDLGPQWFMDAAITGTGFLKVCRDGRGYPLVERVFPLEILVDPRDGMYGKPQCMYQVRTVDREVLLSRFGDMGDGVGMAIRNAKGALRKHFPMMPMGDDESDRIPVVEAWRLPSGHDADDGMRCLAIEGAELDCSEWDRDHFPFAEMHWQRRQYGFWSRGVVEEVKPIQIELNHALEKIQYILHNVSTVRHWIQEGGRVRLRATKMTNTPGEVLYYHGANPPVTDVVSAVPPELFRHVEWLIQRAYAQVGLSELTATGQKPAGLNSGEAIRTYQDVGTERFVLKGRKYEEGHMDLARLLVEEKADIAEADDEDEEPVRVPVTRGRGETVKTINWKDADLKPSDYVLKVMPQSALPGTPTGRVATVEGWMQSGLITPEQAKELLDFPDIQGFESLEQAARDNILSAIEVMIEDGKYVPPEPMMDLQLAMPLVASAYNKHRWEGAPEERLELLTRFNDDIEQMMADAQRQQAEQQQAMQAPAAAGGALPGADVTSLAATAA